MLGCYLGLAYRIVSRRLPVPFPLQLSNCCKQHGPLPCVLCALTAKSCCQGENVRDLGPVECSVLVFFKAC